MAVPVARVHLAMAHAALPGLLPTPPQWKMMPLLPTPSCTAAAVIIPDQSPPNKPGRADAVERWDACKTTPNKSPPKPASRADAAERWDARKITAKPSSGQPSSPDAGNKKSSSASSSERWDIRKKIPTSFSSTKWERTKRPVSRGSSSSSDERWDAHKKAHRPPQGDGHDDGDSEDDVQSSTGSKDVEVDEEPRQKQMGLYAGRPDLLFAVAPPEPSMLPVPAFLVLPRFVAA